MERKEKILEIYESIKGERLNQTFIQMEQEIQKKEDSLAVKIEQAFQSLFYLVEELQTKKEKGGVRYIVLSFLRSSVFANHFSVRLDAYDARFYLDTTDSFAYCNLEEIYGFFEEDIQYFKKILGSKIIRLKEYELDVIRENYFRVYSQIVISLFKEIIPIVVLSSDFQRITKEKEMKILIGEYLDKTEILFELKEEENEIFSFIRQ